MRYNNYYQNSYHNQPDTDYYYYDGMPVIWHATSVVSDCEDQVVDI